MSSQLSHFALNADDVSASRAFYESVFGWTFEAWGPPGFYRIHTGGEHAVEGALQQRRELVPGALTRGVECTFAVTDLDTTMGAARAAGASVLMERFTISGVGHVAFFADPSGNPIGAMQHDAEAQ